MILMTIIILLLLITYHRSIPPYSLPHGRAADTRTGLPPETRIGAENAALPLFGEG